MQRVNDTPGKQRRKVAWEGSVNCILGPNLKLIGPGVAFCWHACCHMHCLYNRSAKKTPAYPCLSHKMLQADTAVLPAGKVLSRRPTLCTVIIHPI
jgi:hypothetical protein